MLKQTSPSRLKVNLHYHLIKTKWNIFPPPISLYFNTDGVYVVFTCTYVVRFVVTNVEIFIQWYIVEYKVSLYLLLSDIHVTYIRC